MGKSWENGDLYGKSPFLMGKSTISMAIFNSYVSHYQRVWDSMVDFPVRELLNHRRASWWLVFQLAFDELQVQQIYLL